MGKRSSKKSKQANRGPPIGTSITTINNGSTLFLRSRLMEEQAFQKIRECASLNNLSSTDSKEISRLLSFFLDEINDTNDETVQQLQQQIVDMSRIQDEQEEKMKGDREVIERWKGLSSSQTMIIQDLQAENDALHQSMEEAMELASGMKELISYFAHTHEENTMYSQKKICQLQEELNEAVQLKDELYELMEENQALRIEYEKAIQ